jgi:tRNA G18 (ribose-2'-O)-methylase SpoU
MADQQENRNIDSKYTGWTNELIKQDLNSKRNEFAVMMERINGDFNFGTLIRNANAFLAKQVFYLGLRKYDKRSAVGTYIYENVEFLDSSIEEAYQKLRQQYTIIAIDNTKGSVPMESFKWPKNSLMVFGEESRGLSEQALTHADHIVHISMYGSVRSLNVGCASAITMHNYLMQHPPQREV